MNVINVIHLIIGYYLLNNPSRILEVVYGLWIMDTYWLVGN